MKLAATIASLLAAQPLMADTGLQAHLWEHRPILVFADAQDPRLAEQLALFEAHEDDLSERRNLVIVETDTASPLWQRFQPDGFTLVLIGLDGGEKFRAGDVTDPDTFSDLIDTMPMRRGELRGREPDGN